MVSSLYSCVSILYIQYYESIFVVKRVCASEKALFRLQRYYSSKVCLTPWRWFYQNYLSESQDVLTILSEKIRWPLFVKHANTSEGRFTFYYYKNTNYLTDLVEELSFSPNSSTYAIEEVYTIAAQFFFAISVTAGQPIMWLAQSHLP